MLDEKRASKNILIAFDLYSFAYKIKTQVLKDKYPDKSKEEIHKLVIALFDKKKT